MQTIDEPDNPAPQAISLMLAADLQDHLMTATNDLERLQRLIDDAYVVLIQGFQGAAHQLGAAIDEGKHDTPSLQETGHGLATDRAHQPTLARVCRPDRA